MPALLVGSKMKSGLPKPKPVHSALPIPQTHSRPPVLALPAAHVKTQVPSVGQQVCSRPTRSSAAGSEAGGTTQVRVQISETPHLSRLWWFYSQTVCCYINIISDKIKPVRSLVDINKPLTTLIFQNTISNFLCVWFYLCFFS